MFQHILVPVDFTQKNQRALGIALNLAALSMGKVTVLHVIETIADTEQEEFKEFYAALEQRAEQEMNRLVTPHQGAKAPVEKRIIYGQRMAELLRFAHEYSVDLIVMNSHKIDPQDPTQGWGTISYKVGILAECPVMLVK